MVWTDIGLKICDLSAEVILKPLSNLKKKLDAIIENLTPENLKKGWKVYKYNHVIPGAYH